MKSNKDITDIVVKAGIELSKSFPLTTKQAIRDKYLIAPITFTDTTGYRESCTMIDFTKRMSFNDYYEYVYEAQDSFEKFLDHERWYEC